MAPPTLDTDALLAGFVLRAEPLGVRVARFAAAADADRFLAELVATWGAEEAIVSSEAIEGAPGLVVALGRAGLLHRTAAAPEETRDAAFGVSLGRLALAETGSVLLAEETIEDRAVGMLAANQLVVCRTADLVPGLDEAAPVLRALALRPGGSYATLVTGPSRTADIERVLTVGVQGPARVAVLFLDALG